MTKNGIDVSYAQNNVDWQKVKASGVDFAIVRVGWCYNNGALKEDVYFKKHISGALAVGLDVGVYLYSYATTAEAARRAAKEVIEAVKPYKLSYPIAFDIEYESIYTGSSKQVNTDICKAFLDEIEAATMQCSTVPKIFWTPTFIRTSLLPMTNGLHNMPAPAPPSMRMEYGNTPVQGEWMVSREILTAIFLIKIIRLSLQG